MLLFRLLFVSTVHNHSGLNPLSQQGHDVSIMPHIVGHLKKCTFWKCFLDFTAWCPGHCNKLASLCLFSHVPEKIAYPLTTHDRHAHDWGKEREREREIKRDKEKERERVWGKTKCSQSTDIQGQVLIFSVPCEHPFGNFECLLTHKLWNKVSLLKQLLG